MVDSKTVKSVTPLYLKTVSQKFDLMTIFLLDLSRRGIAQLGSIVDCQNLQVLDLSHNNLLIITGIDALKDIKVLSLAYNKLTIVDALKGC